MSSSDEPHTRASDESLASARPSDPGAIMQRPSVRASTIIVDPELIAEAQRLSERPAANTAPDNEHAATPEPETIAAQAEPPAATDSASIREPFADVRALEAAERGEAEASGELHLSEAEADRIADAFRPSWEPPAPTRASAPIVTSAATPEPRPVLLSELPGARPRSGLLIAGGAVLSFFALAALGWAATRSEEPPAQAPSAEQATPKPPAAAQATPAKPAPAQRVAVIEPTPAAPAPNEAAPAEAAPVEPATAEPATAEPAAVLGAPSAPSEPVAAGPSAATSPEPDAVTPRAKPEPVLVALRITTSPREAKLVLDGTSVPNPYDALLPKGESYELEASAPGYHGRTLTIDLERERRVALELQRERKAAPAVESSEAPRAAPAKPARKRNRTPRAPAEPKKGAAFVEESPY
jgi:hypothetical protein